MDPNLVAVEATEKRYRALRHQPSGAGFDETGRGMWPADQFTYALRDEGSIRIVPDEVKSDPLAADAATRRRS